MDEWGRKQAKRDAAAAPQQQHKHIEQFRDLVRSREVLRDRWQILDRLGQGGFGQVFRGFDLQLNDHCAIKIEPRHVAGVITRHHEVLSLEQKILHALQGAPHFFALYGSGREPRFNFVVMELGGLSLSHLRNMSPMRYFSPGTAFTMGVQVVEALQLLHNAGYLHRDVKPSNFVIGRTEATKRMLYMLDFGLSRMYVKIVSGKAVIRQPREKCHFRGTLRYASMAALEHREVCRADDLWSVFYMMLDIVGRRLPWHSLNQRAEVVAERRKHTSKELCDGLPPEMEDFADHLEHLDYFMEPDYNYIVYTFKKIMSDKRLSPDAPYDWEEGYAALKKPSGTKLSQNTSDR